MGLALIKQVPTGQGEFLAVRDLPVTIEPSEAFFEAKGQLLALVDSASSLANSITTDDQYSEGVAILGQVNQFVKAVERGVEPSKSALNSAKDALMARIKELLDPAKKIKEALAQETARYKSWRDEQARREEERQRQEAERERQRKQRELDLGALRDNLAAAYLEIGTAEGRGQQATAVEIRNGLKRWAALDSTPGAFPDPIGDATKVRQVVELAKQHEQARIAADKARQEGDKATARRIEQASAKLELPEVEPVVVEQVQAVPVLVPKADLAKPKGAWTDQWWEVESVQNPLLVPREYLEVSVPLLNTYAKRVGAAARVPGVIFVRRIKTKGVR